MRFLVALVAGAVAGVSLLPALRDTLARSVFARENHRGHTLPTAGGLVVVAAALAVEAGWTALAVAGVGDATAPNRRLVLFAVVGFAFLGLVDDLAGSGADGRGFRGHLRAAAHGHLTTGGLKLAGGAALATVLAAPYAEGRFAQLVVDALVIALAANLANLFDRAPGRTIKVALLATVVLLVAVGLAPELAGVAIVVGATLVVLADDLRERLMLGDTGANALGGALGVGAVAATAPATRLWVMVVLLVLNVASERFSFSRVIDAVPPLRVLDRLGRPT